jgi:hypothetical protein
VKAVKGSPANYANEHESQIRNFETSMIEPAATIQFDAGLIRVHSRALAGYLLTQCLSAPRLFG